MAKPPLPSTSLPLRKALHLPRAPRGLLGGRQGSPLSQDCAASQAANAGSSAKARGASPWAALGQPRPAGPSPSKTHSARPPSPLPSSAPQPEGASYLALRRGAPSGRLRPAPLPRALLPAAPAPRSARWDTGAASLLSDGGPRPKTRTRATRYPAVSGRRELGRGPPWEWARIPDGPWLNGRSQEATLALASVSPVAS